MPKLEEITHVVTASPAPEDNNRLVISFDGKELFRLPDRSKVNGDDIANLVMTVWRDGYTAGERARSLTATPTPTPPCPRCHGTRYIQDRPITYETDTPEEIQDAMLMARRRCPDCPLA